MIRNIMPLQPFQFRPGINKESPVIPLKAVGLTVTWLDLEKGMLKR